MYRVASTISRTCYLVGNLVRTVHHTHVLPRCQQFQLHNRGMSTELRSSLTHEERTATEPRENEVHEVLLRGIQQASPTVRLLRLFHVNKKQPIKVCLYLSNQACSQQLSSEVSTFDNDMM